MPATYRLDEIRPGQKVNGHEITAVIVEKRRIKVLFGTRTDLMVIGQPVDFLIVD